MYAAGIDIGGTKSAVLLAQLSGDKWDILSKERFATIPNAPNEMIALYTASLQRQLKAQHLTSANLKGIGISCGGPLDSGKGVIQSPPNLPGWDNIPIAAVMEQAFGVPCHLQNDANACAVAEWKFGAGQGARNMIFLTFGTGLGAGLILDGKLYVGANDMAGEIGHVRLTADGPIGYGKSGSVEGYCSGGGIAKLACQHIREAHGRGETPAILARCGTPEAVTAKDVAELADSGDEFCREIYRISGEKLGTALSILVDILNPDVIVIGSIFARSGHLLVDSMNAVMKKECLSVPYQHCRVVPSALGEQVGDIAALSVALGI